MTESIANERRTISLFHWVGYGLLVLALFNMIEILVPLRLLNPIWEIQTLGTLIERVVFFLIGLVLILYGQANYRHDWEFTLLKGLSWSCLLIGVAFMLLVPLGINSTLRVYAQTGTQVTTQVNQRISQIQEFKAQLDRSEGEQLQSLFIRLNRHNGSLKINNHQEIKELKGKFLEEISQAEKTLQTQGEALQANQRFFLVKNSAKSNLGALVCGILFIRIWRMTRWARRLA